MPDPSFLVVRLGSLGDIVHTFPAVAALRETFPASRIVWLTHPRWRFLVETSRLASEAWTVETRSLSSLRETIRSMRQVAWNAAIDYQGLWKSAALPLLAGVRRRIGFSSRTVREFGVPMLYTDRVGTSSRHVADQNGELSERAGSKRATAPVNLCIPEPEKASLSSWLQAHGIDRYIVLSPGGGWRSKCWPAARFGSLSHKLRATLSLRCVVNIGPGEEDLATALVAASGDSQPLIYRGNLGQLMALVRGATCIVGGDTGPLHLGVALGAPVVAIFGPTDPARNGPYRGLDNLPVFHDVVLRAPGAHTSHKRHTEPDPAILAIDVDTVFAAVRRVAGAAT